MRILFFGDSITDAGRNREAPESISGLGVGFVRVLADRLIGKTANEYEMINRGNSGNRICKAVKSDSIINVGVFFSYPNVYYRTLKKTKN